MPRSPSEKRAYGTPQSSDTESARCGRRRGRGRLIYGLAKRGKKEKIGICVYCGEVRELTEDHIPPKALFPPELHKNLLRVASCVCCNTGASKDDEYLRTVIALSAKSERGPALKVISDAAIRSLKRPEAAGFRNSIVNGLQETFVKNSEGIIVPATFGNVDLVRFDSVIKRIIKALFAFERGMRLPSGYKVLSYSTEGLTTMDKASGEKLAEQIKRTTATDVKAIGGQQFRYCSVYSEPDTHCSFWVIAIYGFHYFIGSTSMRSSGNSSPDSARPPSRGRTFTKSSQRRARIAGTDSGTAAVGVGIVGAAFRSRCTMPFSCAASISSSCRGIDSTFMRRVSSSARVSCSV